MTKAQLVAAIANQTNIEKTEIEAVLESFFVTVKTASVQDEPIYIRTFGSFQNKKRGPKIARNIYENTTVVIAPHSLPTFKPCKDFKMQVRAANKVLAE